MNISQLPHSIHCTNCGAPHFLAMNRTADGTWSIGYVEFEGGGFIPGLALNDCTTLKEAATRMHFALERYEKRRKTNGQGNQVN